MSVRKRLVLSKLTGNGYKNRSMNHKMLNYRLKKGTIYSNGLNENMKFLS